MMERLCVAGEHCGMQLNVPRYVCMRTCLCVCVCAEVEVEMGKASGDSGFLTAACFWAHRKERASVPQPLLR